MPHDYTYHDISHIIHDHFEEYTRKHADVITDAELNRISYLEYSILNTVLAFATAEKMISSKSEDETSATSEPAEHPGQMDIYDMLGE